MAERRTKDELDPFSPEEWEKYIANVESGEQISISLKQIDTIFSAVIQQASGLYQLSAAVRSLTVEMRGQATECADAADKAADESIATIGRVMRSLLPHEGGDDE